MGTRIYEVKAVITTAATGIKKDDRTDERVYLVEATSPSVAERHVASKFVQKAEIATPKRIVQLMGDGIKVELAKKED